MAQTSIEQVARDVLMMADPVANTEGRLMLDGAMLDNIISRAIIEAVYVEEIFRDGKNITSKYAAGATPLSVVRVPLETPFPSSSRTAKVGNRTGTENNDGIINTAKPLMPAYEEVNLVLNQINDQSILFPELADKATMAPLYDIARKIASYAKSVVEDRTASTLAEIIAYNAYRAMNDAGNIETIDVTDEDAYSTLLGELNTKLSAGDALTGAHTYSTKGRAIIARPKFINKAFTRKSGIILNGSDIAQNMIRNYSFDDRPEERDFLGNAYRGNAMQFDFYECVDYIWSKAEKYLGLTAGALDHILGVAVSYEANAEAKSVDLGVKVIDANETRGMKAQPLNCWGHEALRLSQLIGDTSLTKTSLGTSGFTSSARKYPVAPAKAVDFDNSIKVPVYGADGTIVGYQVVAEIPEPNGGVIGGYQVVEETTEPTE